MNRNLLMTKILLSAGAVALMGSAVGTFGPKDNVFTKIFANPAAVLAAAVLAGVGTYAAEKFSSEDSIAPGIRLAQPTFVPPQPQQTYAYSHPAIAQNNQPLQPLGAAAPSSTILPPAQHQSISVQSAAHPAPQQPAASVPNADGVRGGAGDSAAQSPQSASAGLPSDWISSEWNVPSKIPAALSIGAHNSHGPIDEEISGDAWGDAPSGGNSAWGG